MEMETLSASFQGDRITDLWIVSGQYIRTLPNSMEHLCPVSLTLYPEPSYLELISIAQ